MTGKVEIIVGLVDKADKSATGLNAATSLVDLYNTDKGGFVLVNQSAQTGVAVVAAVTSIVQLTKGLVPFVNLSTNTVAGTMVFLKITAEYRQEGTFKTSDVVSLVGNVAGVVAGFTLLAGAAPAASLFAAVGIGASVYGIVTSGALKKLFDSTILPVWNQYFKTTPEAVYLEHWVAPDLTLVTLADIIALHGNRIAVNHWDPTTNEVTLSSTSLGGDELYGPGQGSSGVVYGGGGVTPPLVTPQPEYPIGRVDISIESINGVSTQDSYGCCTGSQDGYY